MNRRTRSTGDSLDLLLDTVCNAFGGVVFISILIVVLLNLTSAQRHVTPPLPGAQAELLKLQAGARTRQQKLKGLREANRQLNLVEEQFVDGGAQELVVQLEALKSARRDLESEHAKVLSGIADGQAEINRMVQDQATLERELQQAQAELADAQRVLVAELTARARTSKLPRQRETRKQLVAFLLKQGRLVSFYRVELGGRLVLNDEECQIEKHKDGSRSVAPRAAAGLKVDPEARRLDDIIKRFVSFDRDAHFVAVVVWPDSFAHFEAVKKAIVASKFEYQLAPWPDGEPLFIGPSRGVQRVQ